MNKVINELNETLDAAARAADRERYNAAQDAVKANERAMYGCEVSFIDAQFQQAFSKGLYIMGILSDVQEAMAMQDYEGARQFANKAKYLMSRHLPTDKQGRMI